MAVSAPIASPAPRSDTSQPALVSVLGGISGVGGDAWRGQGPLGDYPMYRLRSHWAWGTVSNHRVRWKYRALALAACVLLCARLRGSLMDASLLTGRESMQSASRAARRSRGPSSCEALDRHEGGRWRHTFYANASAREKLSFRNSSARVIYHPQEMDWIVGENIPEGGFKKVFDSADGTMYRSHLGNQQGMCGKEGFRPSHSVWTEEGGRGRGFVRADEDGGRLTSPSFRLLEELARSDQVMCLMGDSIDFQIYDAIGNGVQRLIALQSRGAARNNQNITLTRRQVPINYTNDTGFPFYQGWMTMDNIFETEVSFNEAGERRTVTFQYFKAYGWSPWDVPFMDGCGVVVANLALHYDAYGDMRCTHWREKTGRMGGSTPRFADDLRAAITYLADFASRPNRTAVWRSALPQHFNNSKRDGHYFAPENQQAFYNCDLATHRLAVVNGTKQPMQNYNRAFDEAFSRICVGGDGHTCEGGHAHLCTVNRTSVDVRTVYEHLAGQNCTRRLEEYGRGGNIATGRILRWEIADLFDEPLWHHNDCSHFCYVPPMYEAAFERLNLLLSLD